MPETQLRYGDLDLLNRHQSLLLRSASINRVELEDVADLDTLVLRVWHGEPTPEVLSTLLLEQQTAFRNHVRAATIAQAIHTQEGRAALAASMINPLRRRLNYAGIARQVMPVDPMPGGAVPAYLSAPPNAHEALVRSANARPRPHRNTLKGQYADLAAVVYAPDEERMFGTKPPQDWGWWDGGWWNGEECPPGYWVYEAPWWYVWRRQVRTPPPVMRMDDIPLRTELTVLPADDPSMLPQPRRVTMPMFELHSNPTFSISSIRERRFNIIDRREGQGQDELRVREDQVGQYSNKPTSRWRPPHRRQQPFTEADQVWPVWVEPGVDLRSTDPNYPGCARVVEVHDTHLVLNWNNEITTWTKNAAWFHDEWQYEEAAPSIWERLNAA